MIDLSFIRGNPESDALNREIARISGGVCFLSFSRGKDALAAWLNLSRFFTHIIPFTCSAIPHIPFADEYLRYVERIFGTHVIRVQDCGLFNLTNQLIYQSPADEEWIDELEWPQYDAQDIVNYLRRSYGLPRAWTAYGLNASDSIDRMITVRQCRGRYNGTRSFYPNFDWTHKQIMEVLEQSHIYLSNEYHIAARSFAGAPMPHTVMALHKRAPDVFRQLEYYYPLLRASLCRVEWRNEKCLPKKPDTAEKPKKQKAKSTHARTCEAHTPRPEPASSAKRTSKRSSTK